MNLKRSRLRSSRSIRRCDEDSDGDEQERNHKRSHLQLVKIKDVAYVFLVGEVSPASARQGEVMELLRELEGKMREKGYVGGGNGWELDGVVDEGEEGKGVMVGVHSVKLALVFRLLRTPKGMTIRVMKSLRMCRDCHEAFKLISDIVEREIVGRDLNRFHLFRNGSCNCRDYW